MDIRLSQIGKRFGTVGALADITITIGSGELMALLGPSGSGKTTLLRIIAGLEQADHGSVHFGEVDASRLPVQDRRVGFVFQQYALFRHMSVLDNIAFGLRMQGKLPRAAVLERCRSLLTLVQLDAVEARYPHQLSGGQRQRVALARALAVEPRVLLLDEPFGALDAKVRKDLRRWLREIHDRTGITTVFVTHDQDEALELADRVAVLDEGRLQQVGTPDDIYDRPASPFVYRFIGEVSAIPVEIRDGKAFSGGQALDLPGAVQPGLELSGGGLPPGPGTLFVRPQDIAMAPPGHGGLPARVVSIRRSAAARRAGIAIGEGAPCEIELPAAVTLQPGETIAVTILRGRVFPGSV